MRKIVESKLGKLIISLITTFILFNYIMPTYSHAKSGDWAGKLIEPLADLTCSIGDGLINLMQGVMMPGSPKAVTKRSQWDAIASEDGNNNWQDKLVGLWADLQNSDGWWDSITDAVGKTLYYSVNLMFGLGVDATMYDKLRIRSK